MAKHPAALAIQSFLQAMPILDHRKGSNGRPFTGTMGITWIELYVLYRLAGFMEPIRIETESAVTRPTLRQQLHRFRAIMQQVVRLTCSSQDQWLLQGRDATQHRLQGLGVTTHLTILPWQPHLTPTAQQQIALEVLKSQQGITQPKAMAALQAQRPIVQRRLLLRGRAKWSQAIPNMAHTIYPPFPLPPPPQPSPMPPKGRGDMADAVHHPAATSSEPVPSSCRQTTSSTDQTHIMGRGDKADPTNRPSPPQPTPHMQLSCHPSNNTTSSSTSPSDYWQEHQQESGRQPQQRAPDLVFMQCPKCPHKLLGSRPAFNLQQLDVKTWCKQCKRSWAVHRWQCSCQIPWHTCQVHKSEPHRLRTTTPAPTPRTTPTNSTTTSRTATKRALGQGRDAQVQRWLDLPPTKRARAQPAEVELGMQLPYQGVKHHLLGPKLLAKFPRLTKQLPDDSASPAAPSQTRPHLHPQQSTYSGCG